ncbi:hypothetical protein FOXG_08800 [Fusarium oxysporum f. sp. lycopersici 4287]|uniref:C2H2-type domain-containing protein n=2 Tax=Fusarium oxysporum TaxID=5507 RepID=A0A0J9V9E5_FUSO4|nr:hypothetical protein FOXG_08800 [Fusarium oxysporum f. sp. lycopersici 4287]EXK27839.1 hypothetical protein FOMG_15688 [Fusarium oxysporum f. sp. melonis 26406]KNB07718.1 hypothetical protein FOXG_08800 [Fusarium oxysporum f. sp. lycopersici 4287]
MKMLGLIRQHFDGVTWAYLPLNAQNVLSTEITCKRPRNVRAQVEALIRRHDTVPRASTSKANASKAKQMFKTPLRTLVFDNSQTESPSSAEPLSIKSTPPSEVPSLVSPKVQDDTPLYRKTRASTRSQTTSNLSPNAPTPGPLHRERNLRNSQYSMAPKRKAIWDSDDESEDESRDAQVARRLQQEENANPSLPSLRERTLSKSQYSTAPKRTVIPDSEDESEDESQDAYIARCLQEEEYVNPSLPVAPSQPKPKPQPATRITRSTAKRSAPGASASRPPKKPCLDDDSSDLEFVDDSSDDEVVADLDEEDAAPKQIEKGFIDDHGFIRIGPQPRKATPDIWTAPRDFAGAHLKVALGNNHRRTDARFPNADKDRLEHARAVILDRFNLSYVDVRENWVKYLCDYTGLPLQWSGGSQSTSVESVYPMVIFEGSPTYHAPPNACLIMESLNWAKRRHPPVTLPLVSAWLNACEERDFIPRRSRMSWVFNALSNTGTMTRVFGLLETHDHQINEWISYDQLKRKAILETLRTGDVNSELQNAIRNLGHEKLWVTGDPNAKTDRSGPLIYRELCRIAIQRYGLTKSEFEYYCTVPGPSQGSERVFYPFHALSRPQAEAIGWDWQMMVGFAKHMLNNMRGACNRHAEQAGYGEKHVDAAKLIYWMGTFLCDQITALKAKMPEASQEEIALMMLDRWGLPRVPWTSHIMRSSLCRKQDHGIAMVFGIENRPDFDPVRHIDLSSATVTLDSCFTNMAMRNFDTSSWDSIRTAAMHVPLHHPFWQVTSTLGNEIWRGEWDRSIQPIAPIPEFETHLLSIEAWVDEEVMDPLICKYCDEIQMTAGQLVDHCRKCSKRPQSDLPNGQPLNPDQDNVNEGYWDSRLTCDYDGCSFRSNNAVHLRQHKKRHSDERPYKCVTCGKGFKSSSELKAHKKTHDENRARAFKCQEAGCDASYIQKSHLDSHMRTHKGQKDFKCHVEGCGKSFLTKADLAKHERSHSTDKPFTCEVIVDGKKCGKTFKLKSHLNSHMVTHTGKKDFKCRVDNCGKSFSWQQNRDAHELIHSTDRPFTCEVIVDGKKCGETFKRKRELSRHVLTHSDEKPIKCDECEFACKRPDVLARHKKHKH